MNNDNVIAPHFSRSGSVLDASCFVDLWIPVTHLNCDELSSEYMIIDIIISQAFATQRFAISACGLPSVTRSIPFKRVNRNLVILRNKLLFSKRIFGPNTSLIIAFLRLPRRIHGDSMHLVPVYAVGKITGRYELRGRKLHEPVI